MRCKPFCGHDTERCNHRLSSAGFFGNIHVDFRFNLFLAHKLHPVIVTVSRMQAGSLWGNSGMKKRDAGQKYQVLLAEDDEINQAIVRAFLRDEDDVELTVVDDGRMALETALHKKFDLMIFDQNMPFITGDRVIRHLRAGRSHNATTPVIRFTAEADAVAFRDANGVAEAVLPKPLRSEHFLSTIKTMLDTNCKAILDTK